MDADADVRSEIKDEKEGREKEREIFVGKHVGKRTKRDRIP